MLYLDRLSLRFKLTVPLRRGELKGREMLAEIISIIALVVSVVAFSYAKHLSATAQEMIQEALDLLDKENKQ